MGWIFAPVRNLTTGTPTPRTEIPLTEIYNSIRERQEWVGGSDPGAPSAGTQAYTLINTYRSRIESLAPYFLNLTTLDGTVLPVVWTVSALLTYAIGQSSWTRRPSRAGSATTGSVARGDIVYAEHINEMRAALNALQFIKIGTQDKEDRLSGSMGSWAEAKTAFLAASWRSGGSGAGHMMGGFDDPRDEYILYASRSEYDLTALGLTSEDVDEWRIAVAPVEAGNDGFAGTVSVRDADDAEIESYSSACADWQWITPAAWTDAVKARVDYSDLDEFTPGIGSPSQVGCEVDLMYFFVRPKWAYTDSLTFTQPILITGVQITAVADENGTGYGVLEHKYVDGVHSLSWSPPFGGAPLTTWHEIDGDGEYELAADGYPAETCTIQVTVANLPLTNQVWDFAWDTIALTQE